MNAHQKLIFAFNPTSRPVAADVRTQMLKDPGFGRVFTDHMVTIRWTKDRGWHDAQVRARLGRLEVAAPVVPGELQVLGLPIHAVLALRLDVEVRRGGRVGRSQRGRLGLELLAPLPRRVVAPHEADVRVHRGAQVILDLL